jgi:transcriptional regulator with XRE-family HTH domain
MSSGFGARLRLQRERRQITIAAIAAETKIKASLLERLEHDDVSQWPKGIFRRAYIRAYAQAIGLEPEAVAREFLDLYPDPAEEDVSAVQAAAQAGTSTSRTPTRLHLLIGSALGALPSRRAQSGDRSGAGLYSGLVVEGQPVAQPERPADSPGSAAAAAADTKPVDGHEEAVPPEVAAPQPAAPLSAFVTPRADLDWPAIADICTRLACTADERDLRAVLARAAELLDAIGLIVWICDPQASALVPAISHGYTADVLAQLSRVSFEADNAISAAFAASEVRTVASSGQVTGAIVVPLLTVRGCDGVLALEFSPGGEQRQGIGAAAAILAAQLSTLVVAPAATLHAASA